MSKILAIAVVLFTFALTYAVSLFLGSSSPSATSDWWLSDPVEILDAHSGSVMSVEFAPNGKWIASAGEDKKINVWDTITGSLVSTVENAHSMSIQSLDFHPDGTKLVSSSGIWSVSSSGALSLNDILPNHTSHVYVVKYSPDGKYIASGGHDSIIRIWDAENGRLLHTLAGHTSSVPSLAFAPNGKTLASLSEDHTIRLWDMEDATAIGSYPNNFDDSRGLDFTPDGTQLATGSSYNSIRIWDFANSKLIFKHTFTAHNSNIVSVKYSPDGEYLATGSLDTTVKLWKRHDDFSPVQTFTGHTSWIYSIDFSPDGRKLASGSLDGTIYISARTDGSGAPLIFGSLAGILIACLVFLAYDRFGREMMMRHGQGRGHQRLSTTDAEADIEVELTTVD